MYLQCLKVSSTNTSNSTAENTLFSGTLCKSDEVQLTCTHAVVLVNSAKLRQQTLMVICNKLSVAKESVVKRLKQVSSS